MIQLHIPFQPVPWAVPTFSKYGTYDIRDRDKRCIRHLINTQYSDKILDEYVFLKFRFVFTVPKTYSKKKRNLIAEGKEFPVSCDNTNLQKLYEDCLKGIVIKDDRKVAKIFSEKVYGEKEGVFIKVLTLKEFENENSF